MYFFINRYYTKAELVDGEYVGKLENIQDTVKIKGKTLIDFEVDFLVSIIDYLICNAILHRNPETSLNKNVGELMVFETIEEAAEMLEYVVVYEAINSRKNSDKQNKYSLDDLTKLINKKTTLEKVLNINSENIQDYCNWKGDK